MGLSANPRWEPKDPTGPVSCVAERPYPAVFGPGGTTAPQWEAAAIPLTHATHMLGTGWRFYVLGVDIVSGFRHKLCTTPRTPAPSSLECCPTGTHSSPIGTLLVCKWWGRRGAGGEDGGDGGRVYTGEALALTPRTAVGERAAHQLAKQRGRP